MVLSFLGRGCKNNLGTLSRILDIQKVKLFRIENSGRSHVGHGTNLVPCPIWDQFGPISNMGPGPILELGHVWSHIQDGTNQ